LSELPLSDSDRVLVLAPRGRDAVVAKDILEEAGIRGEVCSDLNALLRELERGAGVAMFTEEAIGTSDIKSLAVWIAAQPQWSDIPFVLLTTQGGGVERNPWASRLMDVLGNVSFLERPFHPTTLISLVRTALRGRRRQYEARARLEAIRESENHARRAEGEVRRLNETLEIRVQERIAELAATNRQLLTQIGEREQVEATLRQMQRLEAVGQLTSGVAHDFNNLLTVVLGNVTFIEKELSGAAASPKLVRRLSHVRTAAERGALLASQLLAFSRHQRLAPKSINLNDAIPSLRDLLQSTLGGSIQIKVTLQPGLWRALVDPAQIELVVLNLAINARDAMQVGGSLTVETANVTVTTCERPEEPAPGEYVMIAVSDNGSGMSREVLAKAFEPFFTTKEIGKGSGLGLSQVLGFAKQSGGGVRIDARIGEGTSVRVYLPRAASDECAWVQKDAEGASASPQQRHAVIMLVDDDSAVREVTASILRECGHVVFEAGSGGAALELLDCRSEIELVVIDFAMPGMNGAEVARQVGSKRPDLPVVFVTGYINMVAFEEIGEERIIKKPFIGEELINKVGAALTRARTPATGRAA
jgi:signal transduction histidine kinase/CheY-like chemotaxis protein